MRTAILPLLLAALAVAGCGNKGPLVLPDPADRGQPAGQVVDGIDDGDFDDDAAEDDDDPAGGSGG